MSIGLFPQYVNKLYAAKSPLAPKYAVRVEEPSHLGIVIPALQVVKPSLGVVVIPSVAEGVLIPHMVLVGDGVPGAVRDAQHLAPRVIGIFYHNIPLGVHQRRYIPHQIVPGK